MFGRGWRNIVAGCFCIYQVVEPNKNPAYFWEGVEYYSDKYFCSEGMLAWIKNLLMLDRW